MNFSTNLQTTIQKGIGGVLLAFAAFLFLSQDALAQYYEMTLNQRRRYDQIHVEIWARSLSSDAPKLGLASLVVHYDNTYLSPATTQSPSGTDSINREINQIDPIDEITSRFHSANGYNALGTQSYDDSYYSLEVNLADLGAGGIQPSQSGRGSFVGKLVFDIIDDPGDSSLTGVEWSKSVLPGDVRIFDLDSNDIETNVTFTDPGDFRVLGITVLSPNFNGQVIDRDQDYISLSGEYDGAGYPIYFERSVNPNKYPAPTGLPPALSDSLGYIIEYSLDNGGSWTESGRVIETDQSSADVGDNEYYLSGNIFNPNTATSYLTTNQDGEQILQSNYRDPVRLILENNEYFIFRSEQAKIRVRQLTGQTNRDIDFRSPAAQQDESNESFILGRLFFAQLDGESQYFKTKDNFSNSTQLTVESWINLNSYQDDGSEPGIIVSSAGPDASEINGSVEGAWMLYLRDGQYPAFRVREILGRGTDGYLASLEAIEPIDVASDAAPLSEAHAQNWVHLAATVNNNHVKLYVNGELVDEYVNNNATDIRMLTTNHPIWLGVNPNEEIEDDDYLNAGVKGVRIWRVALTQDQIRVRTPGVVSPETVTQYGDIRRGLQIYYTFEGSKNDSAKNAVYQNGAEELEYFTNNEAGADAIKYRPDQPHIKLTAPIGGVGLTNNPGDEYEIRWVSYGLGDIVNANTADIEIEYSSDGGSNWAYVKDPDGEQLGGTTAPDVETGYATWEVYENNDSGADLRSPSPFAKYVQLRIRGSEANTQNGLYDLTDSFQVARYFALKRDADAQIKILPNKGLNITGSTAFVEAWVRPYRFPTEDEEFFPIIANMDEETGDVHYMLSLLPTGQLQLSITDDEGEVRTASSDASLPLVRPNSVSIDTAWTHVGAYVFLNNGTGASEVRFYIDGVVQRTDAIATQLGDDLAVNVPNSYPTFIGYYPANQNDAEERGFIGEIRELRLWSGTPNGASSSGSEPTEMTQFIQGALAARADQLTSSNNENLIVAYSMNGGSFVHNGYSHAFVSSTNDNNFVRFESGNISFVASKPYIKLVEPTFKQAIANTKTDVRVRWVGFDYDGGGFQTGDATPTAPSLEFSLRGGGGVIIQPYQYLGSDYWTGNNTDAMSFPDSTLYIFDGTGSNIYYATQVNFAVADPDENNDGNFNDQGPLTAALTNARLRLTGQYTINSETTQIQSEGPLFSVTPASNFTVRVLLEGRHDGDEAGNTLRQLGSSFNTGGLKITIFSDNSGALGNMLYTSESSDGYDETDPANRNALNNRFGNVNFVFTDLSDGEYWVIVEHLNHMPVLSLYPAPFQYTGDDRTTWDVESGWDFQTWNGVDNNVMPSKTADAWTNGYFTAYGNAISASSNPDYSKTGLIYNNGAAGGTEDAMAAMVAGDIDRDGQINAADRLRVRLDDGTDLYRSDVTGDGFVNADDRTIVDRNYGKVSSLANMSIPSESGSEIDLPQLVFPNFEKDRDPLTYVSPLDPTMSEFFIENAKYADINKKRVDASKKDREGLFGGYDGGYDYDVAGEVEINGTTVDLHMYIENKGADFALANATFAVKYNSSVLQFANLTGASQVLFQGKPDKGYSNLRTAPKPEAQNPIPDVKTIEVDYDAGSYLPGVAVPHEKTYLGTLRFNLKNKNGAVSFKWHASTSVHTIEGEIVTGGGNFKDIRPYLLYTALVQTPNGGEALSQQKTYTINWTADGAAMVFVEYSTDGGDSWNRINDDPVSSTLRAIQWETPIVNSTQCLVRILDADTDTELDRSDNMFSILPSFGQITRPSSGDPVYQGGSKDQIRWQTQGFDLVRFEFTSDGGETWQPVSANVSADNKQVNWSIPAVTTKNAIIRMIDGKSEEEIARSTKFKILQGLVQFRNPKMNDVIMGDAQYRIRWNSAGVDVFDIDISADGGNSWERLKSDVTAAQTYIEWQVPEINTKEAKLRALWLGDPEMEYDRTDEFEIKSKVQGVDDDLPAGYEFGKVSPNPFEGKARIFFRLPAAELFKVSIYNSLGSQVALVANKVFTAGENFVEIDAARLDQGAYFVRFESEKVGVVREIRIVK